MVEDAPEELEDKEHVILHHYTEEQVEEALTIYLRRTLSCGRNQNPRLVCYNGPSPVSRLPVVLIS